MKRVRISFCILLAMIGLSIFFNIRTSANCKKLINLVELTETEVNSGNNKKALEYAVEFNEKWEKFHNEAIFMIRGDKLSEIENCYIRIIPLIEMENDELSAELAELKNILIHFNKSEIPTIYNIF
ncbi:MAG: DUF4363 family protein [Oscillospiraceae bacterium]|nr:DUF4363 family protein [Oscillospiraceae bacterium]